MWSTAIFNKDDSDISKGQYRRYICVDCKEEFDVELDEDGNEVDYKILAMMDAHYCHIDEDEIWD